MADARSEDAERMLNIVAAEAWASDSLWFWHSAQRALRDAIIELEDAGAALLPLIDASQWHAKGAMALCALLVEERARTAAEIGELNTRLWEIETMVTS
ncbi:hypothetical protein [Microbacterium tenebrionis]|uniref:Uncharacterized protein n=1 Tax=Microbacterium tenebrionis TaxID=2830665 RepID=A0A9X1LMD8_9MICO|nr:MULTISPECIES: hypothetical protein [Microbacterium]MCC2028344.1 hypothetical protein [Microbacterium tenebrionis]